MMFKCFMINAAMLVLSKMNTFFSVSFVGKKKDIYTANHMAFALSIQRLCCRPFRFYLLKEVLRIVLFINGQSVALDYVSLKAAT